MNLRNHVQDQMTTYHTSNLKESGFLVARGLAFIYSLLRETDEF